MAESRRYRRRIVAVLVALVVALAGLVFLVYSVRQRNDARAELTTAQEELRTARATSSTAATDLAAAYRVVRALEPQLPTAASAVTAIATINEQDLASVRAAIQAGLAGDLAAYNQAVEQRGAIVPEPDAALEQLRQQANAIITALDQVRG